MVENRKNGGWKKNKGYVLELEREEHGKRNNIMLENNEINMHNKVKGIIHF